MISNPILRQAVTIKSKDGVTMSTETYSHILPDQIIDINARNSAYRLFSGESKQLPCSNIVINSMTKAVRNG